MQVPPTPLHRNTFHVPTRRPRSLTSLSTSPRSIPLSRLLVAALAVAVGETWVLDDVSDQSGGVGWLVLAFWVARVEQEVRGRWKKRGKGKANSSQGEQAFIVRRHSLGLIWGRADNEMVAAAWSCARVSRTVDFLRTWNTAGRTFEVSCELPFRSCRMLC